MWATEIIILALSTLFWYTSTLSWYSAVYSRSKSRPGECQSPLRPVMDSAPSATVTAAPPVERAYQPSVPVEKSLV